MPGFNNTFPPMDKDEQDEIFERWKMCMAEAGFPRETVIVNHEDGRALHVIAASKRVALGELKADYKAWQLCLPDYIFKSFDDFLAAWKEANSDRIIVDQDTQIV